MADAKQKQAPAPLGAGATDCQKSLAEFAPAGANKVQSIFAGGMYVGKILLGSQTCERSECAAASRSLFKREPNAVGLV